MSIPQPPTPHLPSVSGICPHLFIPRTSPCIHSTPSAFLGHNVSCCLTVSISSFQAFLNSGRGPFRALICSLCLASPMALRKVAGTCFPFCPAPHSPCSPTLFFLPRTILFSLHLLIPLTLQMLEERSPILTGAFSNLPPRLGWWHLTLVWEITVWSLFPYLTLGSKREGTHLVVSLTVAFNSCFQEHSGNKQMGHCGH